MSFCACNESSIIVVKHESSYLYFKKKSWSCNAEQWCLLVHACAHMSHLGAGGQMPALNEYFSQMLWEKKFIKNISQPTPLYLHRTQQRVCRAGVGMQIRQTWLSLPPRSDGWLKCGAPKKLTLRCQPPASSPAQGDTVCTVLGSNGQKTHFWYMRYVALEFYFIFQRVL